MSLTIPPRSFLLAVTCSAILAGLPAMPAAGQDTHDFAATLEVGESLDSVFSKLNREGHRIVYSSAIVLPSMTLTITPKAASVAEFLKSVLRPWNLRALQAANGDWLIVRIDDSTTRADSETSSSERSSPSETYAGVPIENVNVTATRFGIAGVATSDTFMSREDVQRMPHLADDAIRVLKALPGVTGGDISAKLNIRGGRRDEVLMMVDGAEIHHGFHFQDDAFMSVVDSRLVESMDFSTGGMTADRGDAMSGVVEIQTLRPTVEDEYKHALGISFIGAFGRASGTVADGRGSWIVSARRSYLDLLMKEVEDSDERTTPEYQDLYSALRFELSPRDSIAAHVLLGADDLKVTESDSDSFEAGDANSTHLWLTWDRAWSDSLDASTALAWAAVNRGRHNFDERNLLLADVRADNEFSYIDLRQDWAWAMRDDTRLRWGVATSYQRADYDYRLESIGMDPLDPTRVNSIFRDTELELSATKLGVYGSYLARLGEALAVEVGGRWDTYRYEDRRSFERVSPRVNAVYQPDDLNEFRAGWGVVYQPHGVDQLQVEDGVTDIFEPERVQHAVLGYTRMLGSGWSAGASLYRKDYDDLRPRFENQFDYLVLIAEAESDRIRIDASQARSAGIELTIKRQAQEAWGGWLSYAFAEAEELDADGWHPRSWDQRHSASFGLHREGAAWNLTLSGLYHSGFPTTRVYLIDGGDRLGLGARNEARLGHFLRFDLRASRQAVFDTGRLTYYIDIYNLFGRENPCCVDEFFTDTRSGQVRTRENYLFPRLPSFGFQFEF